MQKIFGCLLLFALCSTKCLAQDTLILRNYKHFYGKIIASSGEKIFIKLSREKGEKILKIDKEVAFKIKYAGGKTEIINPVLYTKFEVLSEDRKYVKIIPKLAYDTIYKPFQYGLGLEVGIINPKEFNYLVDDAADYYGGKVLFNAFPVATGARLFLGARLDKHFDLNVTGVFSFYSQRFSKYGGGFGSLNMERLGIGLTGNYRIPFKRRLGFVVSGGVIYNSN
jgi:hypothetical protein